MKEKFYVCLIFIIGLVFGNSLNQNLVLHQQSVFIPNRHIDMMGPGVNSLYKFISLNDENFLSTLTNDSIQMQQSQSNASKVTFGKVALESMGALGGGLFLAIPISVLAGDDGTQ